MEKKIAIPEGMLEAAVAAVKIPVSGQLARNQTHDILEAALRWLSENPIEPTQKQSRKLYADVPQGLLVDEVPSWYAVEWQRRMFLAPDLEVPEDVDDLLWPVGCHTSVETVEQINNKRIIEAYRRGKEAK